MSPQSGACWSPGSRVRFRRAQHSLIADYWTFADRHMTGLDDRWRGDRLAYTDERGQAEIRENAGMLLTHAIAAFAGHVGPDAPGRPRAGAGGPADDAAGLARFRAGAPGLDFDLLVGRS